MQHAPLDTIIMCFVVYAIVIFARLYFNNSQYSLLTGLIDSCSWISSVLKQRSSNMESQNQPAKRKNDDSQQVPASDYSLEELLANSSCEDFLLSAEDELWLDGPLIEKSNG